MNREKQPLAAKYQRKVKKAVRNERNMPESLGQVNVPSARIQAQIMAKPPKKVSYKKEKQHMQHKEKRKPEHVKILSKRTTPGEIETCDAAPRSVHIEGYRWKQALDKQSVMKNKILTKRLSKKK